MATIYFDDKDIKESKIALVNQKLTPLQSAFLMQYITNLEEQLQQKEDIINKANNYVIDNANIYLNFIGNKVGFFKENDGKTPIELLEILDNKGE